MLDFCCKSEKDKKILWMQGGCYCSRWLIKNSAKVQMEYIGGKVRVKVSDKQDYKNHKVYMEILNL